MAGQGRTGRLHAFFFGELDEAVVCALKDSLATVASQVALSCSTVGLEVAVCQLLDHGRGNIQLQARRFTACCSMARKAHTLLVTARPAVCTGTSEARAF